jgi:hypothetical protein
VSRTRQFHEYFQIKLSLLEISQLRYYAHRYNKDMTDVLRGMMRRYVAADHNFDTAGFQDFVEKVIAPEHRGDKLAQGEIKKQVGEFLAGYPKHAAAADAS